MKISSSERGVIENSILTGKEGLSINESSIALPTSGSLTKPFEMSTQLGEFSN